MTQASVSAIAWNKMKPVAILVKVLAYCKLHFPLIWSQEEILIHINTSEGTQHMTTFKLGLGPQWMLVSALPFTWCLILGKTNSSKKCEEHAKKPDATPFQKKVRYKTISKTEKVVSLLA